MKNVAYIPDLVVIKGETAVTNSLIIAERFGKRHTHVLDSIKNLECSVDFSQPNFRLAEFIDRQGKPRPMYEITRDGAMFLIMGFTGAEAARWKELFIQAFNNVERLLTYKNPLLDDLRDEFLALHPHWSDIRDLTIQGKTIDQIALMIPVSRSAVGRARQRMADLNILCDAPIYRRRELQILLSKRICQKRGN